MQQASHSPLRGRRPQIVAAVALLSGVLAALADLAPTGSKPIDVVIVALAAAAVTWASATTPWWVIAAANGIAAGLSANVLWIAVAAAGALAAFLIGARMRNLPWGRALATLAAVQAFCHLHVYMFLGFSAVVAVVALAAVFALGVRRRPRPVRRRVWAIVSACGVVAAASVVGIVLAGLSARAPLEEANRQAHAGLSALNRGDMAGAATQLRAAADAFDQANDDVSSPWAQGSRLLPVLAQHRSSMTSLSSEAASVSRRAADALARIDTDTVRIVNGRIDLDAVRALQQPFDELEAAVSSLQGAVRDADDQWLVRPLRDKLVELDNEIIDNNERLVNAQLAVRLAPAMLGSDGPRHYFLAFTTTAEARGLGGFMGNYAEITADQGQLTMSKFGRTADLNNGGPDPEARRVDMPAEFVAHWGRFGFVEDDGTTDRSVWSNITMPPDFPTVATLISQLYPQSGGQALDGVFMFEPKAIAAVLGITGPIRIDGYDREISEQNAVQFITKDQYLIEQQGERVDLLEQVAGAAVAKLLSRDLPKPDQLARVLGPLAVSGNLSGWQERPDEQTFFTRVRMDGSFRALAPDEVRVTVDNAGANKLDTFTKLVASSTVDPSGTRTVSVTVTNGAPPEGLPTYVTGESGDEHPGTNRSYITIYMTSTPSAIMVDGVPATAEYRAGYSVNSSSVYITTAPQQTRVITISIRKPTLTNAGPSQSVDG